MTALKTCFKCGQSKPLHLFYKHSGMSDGRLGKCGQCTREDVRANRAKRLPLYRAYEAERNKNPQRRARLQAAWKRAFDPIRKKAAGAVAVALKAGRLMKHPCWVCGENAEAHHASYAPDAWLDVVWLCVPHHRQVHNEMLRKDE